MWEFLFNRDDTNSIQDKNDLIPPTELYKRPPNSFQHWILKIFCGLQQEIEEKHRLLVLSLTFQIKYTQDRDAGIYECQVIKTNRNLNIANTNCTNYVWNLIINTKGLNFPGPNLKKSPAQCHLSWSLYSGTTLGKYGIKLWGFFKKYGPESDDTMKYIWEYNQTPLFRLKQMNSSREVKSTTSTLVPQSPSLVS